MTAVSRPLQSVMAKEAVDAAYEVTLAEGNCLEATESGKSIPYFHADRFLCNFFASFFKNQHLDAAFITIVAVVVVIIIKSHMYTIARG